ncbi:MAG: hypothetical protein C0503_08580 [Gemmatimonas sp.]|nr:hypothetical protein [Gemmatimonas sp.]
MAFDVRLDPLDHKDLPPVEYRWDADTDILVAMLRPAGVSEGVSGSLDFEGSDGSWLTFELVDGRLTAIEVAVWPDVKSVESLQPPEPSGTARVRIPNQGSDGLAAMEVDTAIRAVADAPERTIHFRIGPTRASRAVHVARDLLLEVDAKQRIAGLWFLNVPPFPAS